MSARPPIEIRPEPSRARWEWQRDGLCVGCQPRGHCRLGLVIDGHDDGRIRGRVRVPRDQEGGPGVVHGGIVVAVLDEACAHVALAAGRLVVTGRLEVRFRHPVPVEHDLRVRAWANGRRDDGRWQLCAEIVLPARDVVLASASGLFVERDPDHFGRVAAWLAGDGSDIVDT